MEQGIIEWVTTNPLLSVGVAVLVYVMFGGKVPPFLLDLFRPKPTTPDPDRPPTPDPGPALPSLPDLLPIILQLIETLQNRPGLRAAGLGGLPGGHHEFDRLCCVSCLVELGKCAEQCGDQECADRCYELIVPFVKMRAQS